MSIEAGIQITDVQDEDLVRIAGENLKAILALYSDIKVEAGGTIIVSTRNGTRIKLETVFQKILEINGVELRATVINSNPIKIQLLAVIGQLSDQRLDIDELEHDDVSNGDDLIIDRESLSPVSKLPTTKKSPAEKLLNMLKVLLQLLQEIWKR